MSETWHPVVGHPHYEVSSLGSVRSTTKSVLCKDGRTRTFSGRVVKSNPDRRMGYRRVVLYDQGKPTGRTVHSMVAEAFLGPRPAGEEVRHLNGDPQDNRVSNLGYGTRTRNLLDAVEHGSHHNASKSACPRGHDLREPNLVVSTKRAGRRDCLACSRAASKVGARRGEKFVNLSHEYYRKVMGV